MAPPSTSKRLYRAAHAAMLAAIEIYNKPVVEYREQTFAMLFVNAWETFLKARIVQRCGNKIQAIHVRDKTTRYRRIAGTNERLTIGIRDALAQLEVPAAVRENVKAMLRIRNVSVHLGILSPDLRTHVQQFGTAGILSFSKLSGEWFGETLAVPCLLPVGFLNAADIAVTTTAGQRDLLKFLSALATRGNVDQESEYRVSMDVTVFLNPAKGDGATIGVTDDPSAPTVRLEEKDIMVRYPNTHSEVVEACRARYFDFKMNRHFHGLMRQVSTVPGCVHERHLDPRRRGGTKKKLYNLTAVLRQLDGHYKRK